MTEQKQKLNLLELQNGPLQNRECRDVLCCLMFITNVAAMFYCSYYAYTEGNTSLVFRGTDPSNNICGSGLTSPYKYLYFTNPLSLNKSSRVCVTQCPSYTNGTLSALNCTVNSAVSNCAYKYIVKADGSGISLGGGSQEVFGYDSSVTIDRVCVPKTSSFSYFNGQNSTSTSSFSSGLSGGSLTNLMTDIQNNWYILLAGFGVAILVSLIFMFLLRCLAGLIVWTSIIGTIGALTGLGFILCYSGGLFGPQNISYMGYTMPTIAGDQQYITYYGYGVWGIAGLLLITVLCLCNRIRLAVAVCKCAGKFIVQVCSVMFVPIIMAIVTVGLWAVCIFVMVYLVSAANFVANGDIFTSIVDYTQPNLARFYYFVFGTLWSNALVQSLTTFIIASACCMWYFSHGPGGELHTPVLRSYGRAFRYHFGSLAFGSLLVAIVQFLQLMVEAFKKQAENTGADKNKVMEYIINCLRCCLACVERIVQFINKNAYIQIALTGKNFCMAAKDGFELVWSNPLRYAIVGGIGSIIMFLGKLMIAFGTTLAMYAYLTYAPNTVMGKLLFLFLTFIYSYAVAVVFMIVYSLAMDSLLVCFIVDQTNQKNSGGKGAIRAPEQLAELIDQNDSNNNNNPTPQS